MTTKLMGTVYWFLPIFIVLVIDALRWLLLYAAVALSLKELFLERTYRKLSFLFSPKVSYQILKNSTHEDDLYQNTLQFGIKSFLKGIHLVNLRLPKGSIPITYAAQVALHHIGVHD